MEKRVESPSLATAWRLIGNYQSLLESLTVLLPLGVPDSLLPAAMDEIRQAIRVAAQSLLAAGQDGAMRLGELRSAYQALASFIPYDEANAAARLQAAFSRGDRQLMASPMAQKVVLRAQRIEREAGELGREFDALAQDRESNALLAEIDNLLASRARRSGIASDS
jgi:hypothetical protein